MTTFHKSSNIILQDWKKFRGSISGLNINEQAQETVNFWKKAPIVNFVLNYYDYKTWPTPWELIYENFYDSIAIAYLMSQTLLFVDDTKKHEFLYIKPDDENDYTMILVIDNDMVLNYSYGEIVNINDIRYTNCLIKLCYENKKLKEIE